MAFPPPAHALRWRHAALLLLFLCALAGFAFRARIESAVESGIGRACARKALRTWGLVPSRENVDLYLALGAPREESRGTSGASFADESSTDRLPPADRRFSAQWTYGELSDNGSIAIGVYGVHPDNDSRLAPLARACPETAGSPVSIRWLRSRDDLLRAFAEDDLVLYFGHAHVGRGIVFDGPGPEEPLWMGRDVLAVPRKYLSPSDVVLEDLGNGILLIQGGSQGLHGLDVRCKVFGYFGCRTDRYFRETWHARFPRVDFIGTAYVCNTLTLAPGILSTLVQGLRQGHPLADIVPAMNHGRAVDLLFGRITESSTFHNTTNHPAALFVAHSPED